MKTKKFILKKSSLTVVWLLAAVMLLTAVISRFKGAANQANAATAARRNSLSMTEVNSDFDKMVLRATMNKTLIFVEKLYFDYSPLSSNRLRVTQNEETDYVIISVTNEAGEWANVWGYVRSEKGIRPDDPLMRETDLTYLEINQYWEWRTFTNEERWNITVKDGYSTVNFTFDINDRKDGAVYFIDGVYALPEHYYPQVAYWWDLTSANPELMAIRNDYKERAIEAAAVTPEGEPLRLESVEYKGSGLNTLTIPETANVQTTATGDDAQIEPMFWGAVLIIVAVVVVVTAVVVACTAKPDLAPENTPSNITDAYDPDQRSDDTPPAPTQEQRNEYEEQKPELTEVEKEELEKRKEFSIDNDAPTGQKIVKLKVKDSDGILQPVYDENGDEVYVNRKTYTVGNATYAIINRETNLLIRFYPSTMELKDIVGNRITVNADNKLMNMDGVQPYSPKSRDDILKKLGDMGVYTSSVDPARMLFRMDDDTALIRAMNLKENNINKGFWETIGAAFKNLFGGGNGSKGFLSNFLDVLILVGVILSGAAIIIFVIWFLRRIKSTGKTAK